MHPWHLPGPSIQKVLSAWKGGFVWQPLTFGVRGRCPYHSLCSPGLRCSGHLGFFLEIFHQTWISEELGNKKTCTFLWEGEVKRGTRRKERSLLRKGMGQGGSQEPQLLKPACLEPKLRNKRHSCSKKRTHGSNK